MNEQQQQTTDTTNIEDWLDTLDADDLQPRDASHLRSIMAANERVGSARSGLDQAVWEARRHGDSWAAIGAALGVSRQAAQSRFAAVAAGPAPAARASTTPGKAKSRGRRLHPGVHKTALVKMANASGKIIKASSTRSTPKVARPHRHVDADSADRKR